MAEWHSDKDDQQLRIEYKELIGPLLMRFCLFNGKVYTSGISATNIKATMIQQAWKQFEKCSLDCCLLYIKPM